MTSNQAKRYCP